MPKKALCIGINHYPGADADLQGCVNDAYDWAEELARQGYGVSLLLDEEAKRMTIIQQISKLVERATSGDTVMITFSGHGTWAPDTTDFDIEPCNDLAERDEGLCPYDISTAGPLLENDLHGLFSHRAPGVRIVMLADSSHCGPVSREYGATNAHGGRARFLSPQVWSKTTLPSGAAQANSSGGLSRVGGDLLLSGCQDSEYSWDARFHGRANGAFTYHALQALRDSRTTSYQTWFNVIREYLPSSVAPQTPQIFGASWLRKGPVFL